MVIANTTQGAVKARGRICGDHRLLSETRNHLGIVFRASQGTKKPGERIIRAIGNRTAMQASPVKFRKGVP